MMDRGRRWSAVHLCALGVPGGWVALSWATADAAMAVRADGEPTFDELIGLAALAGTCLAAGWLTLGLVATLLAAMPGAAAGAWDRLARRVAPPAVRRLAQLAAGATVVTCGITLPAGAAFAQSRSPLPELDHPVSTGSVSTGSVSTGSAMPSADPQPADPLPPKPERAVFVERGDTLWDIAAARLGAEPSNAEIAQAWPRWYAENRQVIGTNPDLIFPGQRLHPPN